MASALERQARTMRQAGRNIGRRLLATALVASTLGVTGPLMAVPTVAYAATEEELAVQLEQAQTELDQATANVKRLKSEIKAAEDRIVEITKQLPNRRDSAADTMKTLYKEMSIHNLHLDIILNSDNVEEIMDQLIALEDVQKESFGQINGLTAEMVRCAEDNVTRKEELEAAKEVVTTKTAEVESLDKRLARVKDAPPAIEGCDPIDWSMSDEEIIAEWAPRIDAYLEGFPLEGYGEAFVKAGLKYGVDPRMSVAISNTESTRGKNCFASHNCWGWMDHSFDTWDEGIEEHAALLAGRLYRSTLDEKTAQTYCPPTWQTWLNDTLYAARCI